MTIHKIKEIDVILNDTSHCKTLQGYKDQQNIMPSCPPAPSCSLSCSKSFNYLAYFVLSVPAPLHTSLETGTPQHLFFSSVLVVFCQNYLDPLVQKNVETGQIQLACCIVKKWVRKHLDSHEPEMQPWHPFPVTEQGETKELLSFVLQSRAPATDRKLADRPGHNMLGCTLR